MATIGYGNQVPETSAGRYMVFTCGFLSILVFAGVLSNAGNVISLIFDDLAIRCRLNGLSHNWAGVFVWGFLYYAWMFVIASEYTRWQMQRLQQEVSLKESYWFAYISTTTVGFGDFYLDPEVLIVGDLFRWPLLFLIGFSFLSSFLGKLLKALEPLLAKRRPLAEVFKSTGLLWSGEDVSGVNDQDDEDRNNAERNHVLDGSTCSKGSADGKADTSSTRNDDKI
jgi:hypothetical protein